jgi:hypothetical protein
MAAHRGHDERLRAARFQVVADFSHDRREVIDAAAACRDRDSGAGTNVTIECPELPSQRGRWVFETRAIEPLPDLEKLEWPHFLLNIPQFHLSKIYSAILMFVPWRLPCSVTLRLGARKRGARGESMRIESWVGVTAVLLLMLGGAIAAEPQQCRLSPLPANIELPRDLARVAARSRS